MGNEAGHQVDTSSGAGEAPHGAGAPESQPQTQTPGTPTSQEPQNAPSAAPTPAAPSAAAPAPAPAQAPTPKPMSVDEMLANPAIQAELNKRAKLAAKQAQEEATEAARVAAERAKMEETERLKLEKREADEKAAAANARAVSAERERDLGTVLVTRAIQLQDTAALDFVRHQAFAKVEGDPNLSMDQAVSQVLDAHKYLIRSDAPAPAPAASPAPAQPAAPPQRPSTAPSGKATQTPAGAAPTKGVDVTKMSRAEYEEYKRETHQIH